MATNIHDIGDLVRVSATFSDAETEDELDPDEVNVSVRAPDGTITTYVYGDDAELVRDDVGEYHADIDVDQDGDWYYRWWSTGEGQAGEERRFKVREARAVES